jgi:pantoate--beta-alanine ligase
MTLELTEIEALRRTVSDWKSAGDTVALIPTMGALHAGHMQLVRHAQAMAKRIVVSIFVNPLQFGAGEDFDRYPRPHAEDLAQLRTHHVDALWHPNAATMYPSGFASRVLVSGISEGLDGLHRPGHFEGVATVVSKLLLQVLPDVALFGEKDYQQLCLIRRMVRDLNLPVRIEGVPVVREADGLALSSRNRYLSASERAIAPALHQSLQQLAHLLRHDSSNFAPLQAKMTRQLIDQGFRQVDYLALCDQETLAPLRHYQPGARLLVAAWLGQTRLIDTIGVDASHLFT